MPAAVAVAVAAASAGGEDLPAPRIARLDPLAFFSDLIRIGL
jgi:hypothetical protein